MKTKYPSMFGILAILLILLLSFSVLATTSAVASDLSPPVVATNYYSDGNLVAPAATDVVTWLPFKEAETMFAGLDYNLRPMSSSTVLSYGGWSGLFTAPITQGGEFSWRYEATAAYDVGSNNLNTAAATAKPIFSNPDLTSAALLAQSSNSSSSSAQECIAVCVGFTNAIDKVQVQRPIYSGYTCAGILFNAIPSNCFSSSLVTVHSSQVG